MAAAEPETARPPAPPPGFALEASNGYSIRVAAISARGKGWILLLAQRRDRFAGYMAPAMVAEDTIRADLGSLGGIDVTFQPSGGERTQRPSCDGDQARFSAGSYRGRIDFTGEEGYTRVSATEARGDLRFLLDALCSGPAGVVGTGPGLPGAQLKVRQAGSGPGPSFAAGKNLPSGRAIFRASVNEKDGRLSVTRSVGVRGMAGTFRYDPKLQAATVSPPQPFSGTATYRRRAKSSSQWTGSLSVDFPGRSGVSLAGSRFRASLSRARWDLRTADPGASSSQANPPRLAAQP